MEDDDDYVYAGQFFDVGLSMIRRYLRAHGEHARTRESDKRRFRSLFRTSSSVCALLRSLLADRRLRGRCPFIYSGHCHFLKPAILNICAVSMHVAMRIL